MAGARLTDIQRKRYIKKLGICCPFCGSLNLHFTQRVPELLADEGLLEWHQECQGCGKQFWDVYKLFDVREDG